MTHHTAPAQEPPGHPERDARGALRVAPDRGRAAAQSRALVVPARRRLGVLLRGPDRHRRHPAVLLRPVERHRPLRRELPVAPGRPCLEGLREHTPPFAGGARRSAGASGPPLGGAGPSRLADAADAEHVLHRRVPTPATLELGPARLTFVLALAAGWSGYGLPDDLLAGTGLRIVEGILIGIPVVGTWASFVVFGGEFPATSSSGCTGCTWPSSPCCSWCWLSGFGWPYGAAPRSSPRADAPRATWSASRSPSSPCEPSASS